MSGVAGALTGTRVQKDKDKKDKRHEQAVLEEKQSALGSSGISHYNKSHQQRLSTDTTARRSSVGSLLSLENEPIKKRFVPFFRKFWPDLDKKESTLHSPASTEIDDDDAGDKGSEHSINPRWYGKPIDEIDPFIFDDVSFF